MEACKCGIIHVINKNAEGNIVTSHQTHPVEYQGEIYIGCHGCNDCLVKIADIDKLPKENH